MYCLLIIRKMPLTSRMINVNYCNGSSRKSYLSFKTAKVEIRRKWRSQFVSDLLDLVFIAVLKTIFCVAGLE